MLNHFVVSYTVHNVEVNGVRCKIYEKNTTDTHIGILAISGWRRRDNNNKNKY